MAIFLKCGLCGDYRTFERMFRVYDTPDQIRVIEWPCWCWECGEVSLAEYVPDLDEIIAEAKAWRQRNREHEYRIGCGPLGWRNDEREAWTLAYYDDVFRWRQRRRSLGRCLFCGSVMVSLAASLRRRFEHPGCGGMFEYRFSIFGGTYRVTQEVYSSEGVKLFEEQVIV